MTYFSEGITFAYYNLELHLVKNIDKYKETVENYPTVVDSKVLFSFVYVLNPFGSGYCPG